MPTKKYIIYLIIFLLPSVSAAQNPIVAKFAQISNLIEKYYVDSINFDSLEKKIFNSVLHELDPHSSYFPKEEIMDMNNRLNGHFFGVGIRYYILQDTITVFKVQPGSPAEQSGLQKGDRILIINGTPVANKKVVQEKVHQLLGGEKGTNVFISVYRPVSKEFMQFKITRDKIPYASVESAYFINDSTYYIKLQRFASTTGSEINREIKNARHRNACNVILDLRDNGGGLLTAAIDVAGEFLTKKNLVVYTYGQNTKTDYYYPKERKGDFIEGNLILLVNEYSASASEIVAGALQDWDRAIIVGRRTYGKALVQRPFNLDDGSAIRLTIGRYYLPTGRMIQKPFSSGYSQYSGDIKKRISSGELFQAEKNTPSDSFPYKSKIKQRTLYSYEGVMPDFFVPLDTNTLSLVQQQLISSEDFMKKLIDFGLYHANIQQNMNESEFSGNFSFSKENLDELGFTNALNIGNFALETDQNKYFLLSAKAYLGDFLYDNNMYIQIMNLEDKFVNQAVELFSNVEQFSNFTFYSDSND